MRTNLLIGNGINQCSDNKVFSSKDIRKRFIATIFASIDKLEFEMLKRHIISGIPLLPENADLNIEILSHFIFNHVKENVVKELGYFSGNDEQRMKRIMKKIAIQSIFLDDGVFLAVEIWPETVMAVTSYQNIYTLNYYEYWDSTSHACYLHNRMQLAPGEYVISGYDECVFSSDDSRLKSDSDALYPSEGLYPAEDLVPMGRYELYSPLKGINEITVFGVSPYGDSELIEAIKEIPDRTIFIYQMVERQNEFIEWQRMIGDATYLDSADFTNDTLMRS